MKNSLGDARTLLPVNTAVTYTYTLPCAALVKHTPYPIRQLGQTVQAPREDFGEAFNDYQDNLIEELDELNKIGMRITKENVAQYMEEADEALDDLENCLGIG